MKTKPYGVRFDEDLLKKIKKKEKLTSPQQVVGQNFELAKRMAVEFATWFEENHYKMVDREEDKHKGQWYKYFTMRKDYPAGYAMAWPVYEYFSTEQLLELYLNQK